MKKLFVQLTAVLVVFLFTCVCFATVASANTPPPTPTKTINPFSIVDIPDPNLRDYLHTKTGVAASEPIRIMNLSGLSGALEPKGLSISNAEGIQYCSNIVKLDMSNNNLSAMPNLSGMKKLTDLNLSKNKFKSIPEEICGAAKLASLFMDSNEIGLFASNFTQLTALKSLVIRKNKLTAFPDITGMPLEVLNINDNPIKKLPDNISNMTGLIYLYADDCGIQKLPAGLFNMAWLKTLSLEGNDIGSIPKNIKNMTALEKLVMSGNNLEELPAEICTLPALKTLLLMENEIYDLPGDIGKLKLEELYLNDNNLSALPSSIKNIGGLKELDIRLNRLNKLPSGLDGIAYAYFNAEWNFLDVSDGSSTRQMLDNITATTEKAYLRQLTPMKNLKGAPQKDSAELSWDPCPDGSASGATWKVKKYVVYAVENNKSNKLAELQPSEKSYAVTGLNAATEYTYRVGVEYGVDDPPNSFSGTTRNYSEIDVKTAAALSTSTESPAATTASVSPFVSQTASASETQAVSASGSAPAETIAQADTTAAGISGWLVIVIIAIGVLVLAAIVLVVILLVKKGAPKAAPPAAEDKKEG